MSFIGQFPARLDTKNRLFLPAGFRRILQQSGQQTFMVRDYFENCLVIYPMSQWQEDWRRSVPGSTVSMPPNRWFIANWSPAGTSVDANGRILLPKHMLERVGIEQDVLFVGMEQTIEIWA